ncbi:uncharacterized protein LOC110450162 [Mizuhopecten yessoensis]|uniref:uncharacterized protein LOC110450162 n=1 Tax=Mizuhopecten yessoensis TaxID=6573 RepID=UPI000B459697|nr:uncharacterized protein LOC110450162 [Mizuhopecten yessoensis]
MRKSCCVSGGTSNKKKNPGFQFFIIPSEKNRRAKWLSAINRAFLNEDGTVNNSKGWSPPSAHCYVCSAHFISGEKINDPRHPDYVPSVFPHNENSCYQSTSSKSTEMMDRYQSVMKRTANTGSGVSQVRKKLKLNNPVPETNNQDERPPNQSELTDPTPMNNADEEDNEVLVSTMSPSESDHESTHKTVPETPMQRSMEPSEREMLYTEIDNLRHERDEALEQCSSTITMYT